MILAMTTEAARVLGEAIDCARQREVAVLRATAQ
jgi:hypothetical protein